jgi:F-type H+-transporting ATPase subunit epsilon
MAEMTLRLVSPEGVLFEGPFDSVVLPSHDGLRGILPGHAPFVGRLGIGKMRVLNGDEEVFFGLFGGFLLVTPGRVEVVVDRADRPQDLDLESCRTEFEALRKIQRLDYERSDDNLRHRRMAEVRKSLAEDARE